MHEPEDTPARLNNLVIMITIDRWCVGDLEEAKEFGMPGNIIFLSGF